MNRTHAKAIDPERVPIHTPPASRSPSKMAAIAAAADAAAKRIVKALVPDEQLGPNAGLVGSRVDPSPVPLWDALTFDLARAGVDVTTTGPEIGTEAFERDLDRSTGGERREGNLVTPLFDGVRSFAARFALIEAAKHEIDLQTFIFTGDETGWKLTHALVAAANRGVRVRVIYDAAFARARDQEMYDLLRAAGCEVRVFSPLASDPLVANMRSHQKHLIVDGQVAIEGGMNSANEYAFGGTAQRMPDRPAGAQQRGWRDADVALEGPVVAGPQLAFLRNWAELGSPVPRDQAKALLEASNQIRGHSAVRFVEHKPGRNYTAHAGHEHAISQTYLAAIRGARRSIRIEQAYFIPPAAIRLALEGAAVRGVTVEILTNGHVTTNHPRVVDAARYLYPELLAAGVQIYERQLSTLHAKTATFDGHYTIVGSANLNGRSETLDAEAALATDDPQIAAQSDARFADGRDEAHAVTLEEMHDEDVWTKLREFASYMMTLTM